MPLRKTVSVENMETRLDALETLYRLRQQKCFRTEDAQTYGSMIAALRAVREELGKEQRGEKTDA